MNTNKHFNLLLNYSYSLLYLLKFFLNNFNTTTATDKYSIYGLTVCNITVVRFTFTGIS
jgi:hypothetical protein